MLTFSSKCACHFAVRIASIRHVAINGIAKYQRRSLLVHSPFDEGSFFRPGQVARSPALESRYVPSEAVPVHRGFIAMSGRYGAGRRVAFDARLSINNKIGPGKRALLQVFRCRYCRPKAGAEPTFRDLSCAPSYRSQLLPSSQEPYPCKQSR